MEAFFLAIVTGLAVGLVVLYIGRSFFDWTSWGSPAAAVGGAVFGLMITRLWK
jgi:K+-transporting ATPase c subunit